MTPAEALAALRELKLAEKLIKARTEEALLVIDGLMVTGQLDELSYEPGVYEGDGLQLTRRSRTTWSYSPAIKALQEAEQENGMATAKTSEYWFAKVKE
jgi:hypothetical protein